MIENIDFTLVNWSRGQFAMIAFYHWLFIPITIGTTYIIAIAQTIHVKTGDPEWERLARFWAKLFGINFAIGVGTGIILGLEFGTNWANYSWIAGDIFGAPLAAEGIMAFFLESTFIAVMFFGWGKVGKKFHLLSCWLVAFGASLSALWILVANGWMNYPIGMVFNPDTARHEMVDFWAILFSPYAVNKFLHTITSCLVISAFFVIAISSWYLLKKRSILLAKRSIVLAATFGLLSSVYLAMTGDGSAYYVAQKQPAKLATMEGLFDGEEGAGLVMMGILNPNKKLGDDKKDFLFKMEIPKMLSILGYRDANAFVPGMNDLVYGNEEFGIMSAEEKMGKGRIALGALADYKEAHRNNDQQAMDEAVLLFNEHYQYMGYGNLHYPEMIIPRKIPLIFYSFRIMVISGMLFIGVLLLFMYLSVKNRLEKQKWLLYVGIWCFPLSFIASMAGWIVAEVGRQPWTIQGLLPTMISTSNISANAVIATFWLFAAMLTVLVIAEYRIMIGAIRKGPDNLSTKGGPNV
ncbi:cytochrome ubiquinol oxidase subunit I [Alkalitalea saponilacus]|uniref:Cytochrome bd-I ubiquinol oxidase subunit 1 apoprotein n=1 Tax=Alkalitalea saponilacus TaxID=889453 RepID=A0A1T5AIL7_9BACT|nr:cytochrome ubiquinol oxidase subunit I [Alkalitalea saponilacus]ASB48684.1 cytochrome ubiquinol oxidase subunit I [Alkalitalea saponilacus]SKB34862.1 cytochrome bd-I ubiquinol oxidase subunit 1 apoprotein [Alkalitalea saponilacus]